MTNKPICEFQDAYGPIAYNMTNNYMFRYILQTNQKILHGLTCALLHLKSEEIHSIQIKNPIDLASDVSGKEFILDIKIILNNSRILNLEMQVKNEHNWPERSLIYLCRSFDQLYRGQEYADALPAIHIGFVDFTLDKENPEFYATHMLTNVKTQRVYSDKFILSVVDLSKIELATDEDKTYNIDRWAKLFKAKTWEELKMYVIDDEYLTETAHSLYQANADDIVREQCLAREDAERMERTLKRDNNLLKQQLQALQADCNALQADHDALQADRNALQAENLKLLARIAELENK